MSLAQCMMHIEVVSRKADMRQSKVTIRFLCNLRVKLCYNTDNFILKGFAREGSEQPFKCHYDLHANSQKRK